MPVMCMCGRCRLPLKKKYFSLLQIPLFITHPQLKACIKQAFERAVQEMLTLAIDRATKIALTTSEQIVKKVLSAH